MIEQITISHHIQRSIIDVLMYKAVARFRDLRPARVDTNLFSYHLQALIKNGLVQKVEGGYTLTADGLSYVDRVSSEKKIIRSQPKIVTMLLVQNSDGDVLLQRRSKQPYIDTWTLPYGKLHIEDETLEQAASREAEEKLGLIHQPLAHVGDAYIRVKTENNKGILSTTLAHIFRCERDDIAMNDHLRWVQSHKLASLTLAPAVEAIVARSFFHDPFFFEEFVVQWGGTQPAKA